MATKYALVAVSALLFVGTPALGQWVPQPDWPKTIIIDPPRELTHEEKYEVKKPSQDHAIETEKPTGEAAKAQLPPPPLPPPQLREFWPKS